MYWYIKPILVQSVIPAKPTMQSTLECGMGCIVVENRKGGVGAVGSNLQ